jgi:tetratricopeptide (TPR) repeat protein
LGSAYALSGRVDEAAPLLEQAVEEAAGKRLLFSLSLWVGWLGEAYLLAGRLEAVLPLAERALKLSCDHQERGNQAWALRLLGEVRSHQDPPQVKPAETCYREALALASELGMRPLVAHCHLGLGALYNQMGWLEQARPELSAAIELYRAMEMAFWVTRAEAILAQAE